MFEVRMQFHAINRKLRERLGGYGDEARIRPQPGDGRGWHVYRAEMSMPTITDPDGQATSTTNSPRNPG